MPVRIGSQAGRHPMPVERYILTDPDVGVGQAAYDAAYEAASAWLREPGNAAQMRAGIELFYAGLTEVTLGVVDALQATGYAENVVLMRFDRDQNDYLPLRRVVPAEGEMSATMWVFDQRKPSGLRWAGIEPEPEPKPLTQMTDAEASAAGLITITPAVP